MRGLPGSGKSHDANNLAGEEGVVCSADDFFGTDAAEYRENYDRYRDEGVISAKLYRAHKECQEKANQAMIGNVMRVVIDNTNVTKKDIRVYAELALVNDYDLKVCEPTSEWWREISVLLKNKGKNRNRLEWAALKLSEKNSHGVPQHTIEKMMNKWWVCAEISINDFV